IEKEEVGGTCLNWGCIPTKALVASAEAFRKAGKLEDYGIELFGHATPSLPKIMERKQRIVSTQIRGIRSLFKSWGVRLVEGAGTLLGPGRIEVRGKDGAVEVVESDTVIIATGSRPAQLPLFPFDGKRILSSNDAVTIDALPRSLLIVGAGVIGCEFACIFRELGTEVTMVELMPRALSTEDHEIAEVLERELKKKKIKLLTGVKIERAEVRRESVHVFLGDGKELSAEKLLVSIGRSLNTGNIGLEEAGVRKGPRGEILVNEKMETTVGGIYAVGDVTGGALLAHVASREGVVAAGNACGREERIDYSVIPAGIFTSPEIGSVGLREQQAAERGIAVRTGRFPFRALGKAHAMGEIEGMIKVVSDAGTDKVLGVHCIGAHAADLVHEGALAIKAGLTTREVASMIHAHPTLAEGLMEAAEDVHGEAIHQPKK
ncbi:MAG: dihydrolipoyl dehydrogenase, partial [Thermodesulfovibrionales bacterium]